MYIYRYVCLAKRKKNLIWSIEWTEEKPTKKNSLVRCTEARDENECCDCCHSEWRLIFSTVLKILKEVKVWFFFFGDSDDGSNLHVYSTIFCMLFPGDCSEVACTGGEINKTTRRGGDISDW